MEKFTVEKFIKKPSKEHLDPDVDGIEWWYECPACGAIYHQNPAEGTHTPILEDKGIGEGSKRYILHPERNQIEITHGSYKVYCNKKCATIGEL